MGWLIWETYHQLPFCSEHHQQPPTRPRKRSSISSTRWTHRPTTWLYRWANSYPLRSEFLPAFEYLFDGLLELTLLLFSASSGWTIRWRLFPSPARNGIIHLLRFCLFWQNWQKNMSISALCYGSFLWLGSYLTGEAGPGLVSDDHTPSPIRQMDQGSNSEISSSARFWNEVTLLSAA